MRLLEEIFLILLAALAAASAALLQNGNFEFPPSNIKPNSSTPLLPLSKNNTIPGWSFNGTVYYVTAGPNISLPDNGHAIQLGLNGVIRQTIRLTSIYAQYILTFSITSVNGSCKAPAAVLNVSFVGSWFYKSSVFLVEGKYGRKSWESHACSLGRMAGEGDPVVLELRSQSVEADHNVTCGPVVDTAILKRFDPMGGYADEFVNGGFEDGPIFIKNSSEGILLEPTEDLTNTPLFEWAVFGAVKYVDSKHYLVPEGNAAVEIVSTSGAIRTILLLKEGSSYRLEFVMGVPIDSCTGELILGVQAGPTSQNFTLPSNGTGYSKKFSLGFRAETNLTSIGFMNIQGGETSDHMICGPLVDNVICGPLVDNVSISASLRLQVGLQQLLLLPSLLLAAVLQIDKEFPRNFPFSDLVI
ncbi:hypothetical protein C4D60_Mb06t12880 [Musa balbisiana]|uniref:DUF642 domain-containing protein n=1 Tax=Musa balbisiana TaxID=52838 RepID=A0A4V4H3W1_MUSBA|nr:hypothetical protein C4D60_Mb06t12880 [Musa balbisiana]